MFAVVHQFESSISSIAQPVDKCAAVQELVRNLIHMAAWRYIAWISPLLPSLPLLSSPLLSSPFS